MFLNLIKKQILIQVFKFIIVHNWKEKQKKGSALFYNNNTKEKKYYSIIKKEK
jgi:hypothetical protein